MKNTGAVEKIIKELAMKDFLAVNPIGKDGRRKYKHHKPYSLSEETLFFVQLKNDYLEDKITEEEYKRECLKYNLRKDV